MDGGQLWQLSDVHRKEKLQDVSDKEPRVLSLSVCWSWVFEVGGEGQSLVCLAGGDKLWLRLVTYVTFKGNRLTPKLMYPLSFFFRRGVILKSVQLTLSRFSCMNHQEPSWCGDRDSDQWHSNWTNFEEVFQHMTPREEEETVTVFDKCMTDVQIPLIYTILNWILPAKLKASRAAKRVKDSEISTTTSSRGCVLWLTLTFDLLMEEQQRREFPCCQLHNKVKLWMSD